MAPESARVVQEMPWRERVSALRYVPRLLRLVWDAHPGWAVAVLAVRLARGFVPLATLWTAKLILDQVVAARSAGGDMDRLIALVLIEASLVAGGEILARLAMLFEVLLAEAVTQSISVRLMRQAAALDLATLERPEFHDQLERARKQSRGRIAMITQLLTAAEASVTLVTLVSALATFNPWLLLLVVVAIVPSFAGETRFAAMHHALLFRWTQRRRELDYLQMLGASSQTAKEVRVFGLGPWLIARYQRLSGLWREESRTLATRRAITSSSLALVGASGYYGAYAIIIVQTVAGILSIGAMAFLTVSFARARDLVQTLLGVLTAVYEDSLYLRDLFVFLGLRPTIAAGRRHLSATPRHGFRFEDVGFRYPDATRFTLRGLNLDIRPGESLALVGENGAGKTTLTKLLARLYDPTEGRILLDGVDLRDYDPEDLRRSIGVIFQDYLRYDLRLDENVALGEIERVREYIDQADGGGIEVMPVDEVPAVLRSALVRAGADDIRTRLPAGWRQMLGRRFAGGVELSGGEWQRVALARAHMRRARLLILDEPTAALDARAEYEVFRRFSELSQGRTTVIVSHRFSTVRTADRILVLRAGEAVELGSHQELLGRDGLYRELFALQAAGYR